jgi:hypothetical protein
MTTYQPPYTMGNSLSNNEAVDNDNHTILSLVTLELVSSYLDDQEMWVQQLLDKLRKEEKQEVCRQNHTSEVEEPKRKTFADITLWLENRLHEGVALPKQLYHNSNTIVPSISVRYVLTPCITRPLI